MYEIFKSSEKLAKPEIKKPKRDYPWDILEVGQSFAVNKEDMSLTIARPMCSIQGKLLNKRFRVIEHENVFEFGRLEGNWIDD